MSEQPNTNKKNLTTSEKLMLLLIRAAEHVQHRELNQDDMVELLGLRDNPKPDTAMSGDMPREFDAETQAVFIDMLFDTLPRWGRPRLTAEQKAQLERKWHTHDGGITVNTLEPIDDAPEYLHDMIVTRQKCLRMGFAVAGHLVAMNTVKINIYPAPLESDEFMQLVSEIADSLMPVYGNL